MLRASTASKTSADVTFSNKKLAADGREHLCIKSRLDRSNLVWASVVPGIWEATALNNRNPRPLMLSTEIFMLSRWPRGPMDKASAYGAGDCRLESYRGHIVLFIVLIGKLFKLRRVVGALRLKMGCKASTGLTTSRAGVCIIRAAP